MFSTPFIYQLIRKKTFSVPSNYSRHFYSLMLTETKAITPLPGKTVPNHSSAHRSPSHESRRALGVACTPFSAIGALIPALISPRRAAHQFGQRRTA